MKRPRRHKFISAGVYFLLYAVLIVVSQKTEDPVIESFVPTLKPTEYGSQSVTQANIETNVFDPTRETKEKNNEEEFTTKAPHHRFTTPSSFRTTDSDDQNEGVSTTSISEIHTLRPRRVNCTPPAIEQFPNPMIGPKVRKHGGIIIHILLAIFSFLGLAIVCDDYFVSSLDRICEELKLSPDVAGATFMAAGSSAPELATVIIGVFFAKDDIGISGVIGSAVFNIMFVISVCALCSGTVSYLNWWPLVRDCVFYAISILVMLFTISNEVISWPEALIMLLMYVVYCIVLSFNTPLERWAMSLKLPIKLPTKEEQASLVTYKSAVVSEKKPVDVESAKKNSPPAEDTNITQTNQVGYNTNQGYDNEAYYNTDQWDPNTAWSGDQAPVPPQQQAPVWDPNSSWGMPPPQQPQAAITSPTDSLPAEKVTSPAQAQLTIQASGIPQSYYRPKEYKPEDMIDPLVKPTDAGKLGLASWYIVYPIHFLCRKTMPDCKSERFRNWYPFTFLISMIWISFYSYIMVWMITIIGTTLGIPDTVMGLTFVAAGVSVPDALSSIAVIKEGYGDMAVSNAVGSNVFDILICLGLPWFIQTAIIKPGSHVNVISKGLTYSTLSLLSTVIFLVLATHLNGWKLDRKYGIILMIWYLIFITFASLYELNVFGDLHFPECSSEY